MTEAKANLFSLMGLVDWLCIPTNGVVVNNRAVMGKGVALTARTLWTGIEYVLADELVRYGNIPRPIGWVDEFGYHSNGKTVFDHGITRIWSYPTKHDWRGDSSLELITESAKWLVHHAKDLDIEIALPRPGCSNGRLEWDQVREVIAPILDDRFTVVFNG